MPPSEHELRLRERLSRLRNMPLLGGAKLSGELDRLQRQLDRMGEEATDEEIWQSVELARHPDQHARLVDDEHAVVAVGDGDELAVDVAARSGAAAGRPMASGRTRVAPSASPETTRCVLPDSSSSIGFQRVRVVPTGSVVS